MTCPDFTDLEAGMQLQERVIALAQCLDARLEKLQQLTKYGCCATAEPPDATGTVPDCQISMCPCQGQAKLHCREQQRLRDSEVKVVSTFCTGNLLGPERIRWQMFVCL